MPINVNQACTEIASDAMQFSVNSSLQYQHPCSQSLWLFVLFMFLRQLAKQKSIQSHQYKIWGNQHRVFHWVTGWPHFFNGEGVCQKEMEKFELKLYTQSSCKSSVAKQYKSAISDHVIQTNHNIKWDSAKVMSLNLIKPPDGWRRPFGFVGKKKKHSKQRWGGIQIKQHLWSTSSLPPPTVLVSSSYKRLMLSGKGCQSEEAASLAVKLN